MLRGVVEKYDGILRSFRGKDGGKADGLVDLIRSNLKAMDQGTGEEMMPADKGDGKERDKARLHGNGNSMIRCNGEVNASLGKDVPRRNPPRRSKAWRLKGKMERDDAEIEILESDTDEAGPSFKENGLSNRNDFYEEEEEEEQPPSNEDESSDEEFAPETDRDQSKGTKGKSSNRAVQKKMQNDAISIKNDKPTGSKFVHCPICGKSVSEFFINSHIDQCLVDIDGQNANGTAETGTKRGHAMGSEALEGKKDGHADWTPLPVPPKFIGNLVTEKMIRASLRKYGVATDGKKPELIDRYNRFRLEIEVANDKQETTTYDKIASRISQKERVRAAASLLNKPVSSSSKRQFNDSRMKLASNRQEAQANILPQAQTHNGGPDVDFSKIGHPREIELHGSSFAELIKVTLLRDRFRKKQRELPGNPGQDRPCTNGDTSLPDKIPQQHDDKHSDTQSLEASKIEQELQDVEEIILNSENEDDIW
eukprot:jgi/Picsp_1/3454/NSC_06292-R1_e3 ubiquitin-protein ligase rad18